jgi:hypothetical protein
LDVSAVQESLARCTVRGGFAQRFLDLLAAGDPALGRMLAAGDPQEQRRVVHRGLQLMVLHAQGAPMAATALERLAGVAVPGGAAAGPDAAGNALGVRPDLHPFWVDSLVAAVREFDPDFTPGLEKRWREVVGPALADLAARHRGA